MAGMRTGKVRSVGIVAVGALMLLTACAKSTTPSSGGGSTTSAPSGGMTIETTSVSGVGTVLVDPKGAVLYYLKTETPGNIMCTGSCATAWPPLLLASGTTSATAGSGVTGTLGTIKRPDGGTQVTYNKMPLYTFAGDKNPGEASGQGVASFYAVVASGSGGGSGGGNSGSGGGGGGYGY